jgi:NAD(P)-dependent dehydrogenase (short-subunit alcohol dehydrogenase family)
VRLLTKSVALHGARLKPPVRCNSVHPAFLEGPMVDDILAQTGRPEIARGQLARDIRSGGSARRPRLPTSAFIVVR